MADIKNAIDAAKPLVAQKPVLATREVELEDGATFSDVLDDAGVARADALSAASALGKVYDLRKLKGGQDMTLTFLRDSQNETLSRITFAPEATREIVVERNAAGGFTADLQLIPVTHRHYAARARISTSLYEAGEAAHIPHAVMASMMRIYSHAVDFQRDIHPGDSFEILYDQPTAAGDKPVGQGDIVYAALTIGGKVKPVYRAAFADGSLDYVDEKGQSIRRALLRTPVAAAHITSGFGMRINPILGYSKMHQGVDFGAPPGTPIFAAGAGIIVDIGPKGGYGRYIRIHHNGSLETAYAHMSRFAAGLYRGAQVKQGQVIGYVGTTGRSTGPHLHYEVHVAGRAVNPLSVNMPSGRALSGKLLAAFEQDRNRIKKEFATLAAGGAVVPATGASFVPASAMAPAYPQKTTDSCGAQGC